MNNYQWAAQVLLDGSFPITPGNVQNVVRWMAAENPPSQWYHKDNPLNVADFTGDTHSFGSLSAAAIGTAAVIRQPNMVALADALEAGADLDAFSLAASAAPWSTGGYHGHPAYIASIPLPPVVEAPGSPAVIPNLSTPPATILIPSLPMKEELVQATYIAPSATNPNGLIVTVGVSPSGHPLVFSSADYGKSWEVEDVTDAIATKYPTIPEYVVQP